MSKDTSFPLRIWSGLFRKKHWEKMGNAIWLFGMLIDRVTREENGEGFVLGGTPVSYSTFKNELPVTRKQYNRYMQILRDGGYIYTRKTEGGLIVVVHKSKKFTSPDPGRDKNVPIPPSEGTYLSPDRDKYVPLDPGKGTNMSPSLRDIKGRDITETEIPPQDYMKIWKLIHSVFKLPEGAYGGYKGDIIETIQRLGMEITEKACRLFIENEEDHPPHGRIKSISAFFHWKKIDEYVAMIPEERKQRYFVCPECRVVVKVREGEFTDQAISGIKGMCSGPQDNPDLAHELVQRIEITNLIRDCQAKAMENPQIRVVVDKHLDSKRERGK